MSDSRSTATPVTAAAYRNRGRLYKFAVVALATLLLACALLRGKNGTYTATAVLLMTGADQQRPDVDLDELRGELTDLPALDSVLDQVQLGNLTASAVEADQLRRAITVSVRPSEVSGRTEFDIGCSTNDPQLSMALVNGVCEQFIRGRALRDDLLTAPANRDSYALAARILQQAEDDYSDVKARRDVLMARHIDALAEQPSGATGNLNHAAGEDADRTAGTTDQRQWIAQLQGELRDAHLRRTSLLEQMRPEHPDVVSVTNRIAALDRQLEAARPHSSADRRLPRSAAALLPGSDVATAKRQVIRHEQLRAEYEGLTAELQQADRQRQLAKRRERATWEQTFDQRRNRHWQVEPALAAMRRHRPLGLALLLLATSLGLIAGGGMLLPGSRPGVVDSLQQAESLLSVPVVGTVDEPADSWPEPTSSRGEHRWTARAIVWGAEATLFLFLAATLIAALLDHGFAEQLKADSLSALADSPARIIEAVWR